MNSHRKGMVSVESLMVIAISALILMGLTKFWQTKAMPQTEDLVLRVLGGDEETKSSEEGEDQARISNEEVGGNDDDYDENEWHPDDRVSWEEIAVGLAGLADFVGSGVSLGGSAGKIGQVFEGARDVVGVSEDINSKQINLREQIYQNLDRQAKLKEKIAVYRKAIAQLSKVAPQWPDLLDKIENLSELNDSLKAELKSLQIDLNSEPLRSEYYQWKWELENTA
ncbi:hypothetical protein N9Y42_02950 [Mariniblastus sp.]|nr:hypothetical protein [Mariniblastus sp.]